MKKVIDQEKLYLTRIFTGKNITTLLQQVSEQNIKISNGEGLSDIKAFLQAYAVIRWLPYCAKYADLMKTYKISEKQIAQCQQIRDALERDKSLQDLVKMLLPPPTQKPNP